MIFTIYDISMDPNHATSRIYRETLKNRRVLKEVFMDETNIVFVFQRDINIRSFDIETRSASRFDEVRSEIPLDPEEKYYPVCCHYLEGVFCARTSGCRLML